MFARAFPARAFPARAFPGYFFSASRNLSLPVLDNGDMTAPRQILPGKTYMVTRRCSERRFFLRPSSVVNQIFTYCLASAAEETGVLLHAWACLSNHWHAMVTDPDGRLPEFMAHVNRLVGKCVNVELGRFESLWSPEHYSAVRLGTDADVIEKMLYVLGNPVQGALVGSWRHWPGAISGPRACAQPSVTVQRPSVYFRNDGLMPESARLEATVPPFFDNLSPHEFATRIAKLLEAHEARELEKIADQGRELLGREAVLDQDPFECPKSFDPRFGINPRIACKNRWRRMEALCQLKEFLDAYREAWRAFKSGVKDVIFPAGTYWMVHHAGCVSASPG